MGHWPVWSKCTASFLNSDTSSFLCVCVYLCVCVNYRNWGCTRLVLIDNRYSHNTISFYASSYHPPTPTHAPLVKLNSNKELIGLSAGILHPLIKLLWENSAPVVMRQVRNSFPHMIDLCWAGQPSLCLTSMTAIFSNFFIVPA